MGKRTAALVDITDFDDLYDEDGEPDPAQPSALPFSSQVDDLAGVLTDFEYLIDRPTRTGNARFGAADLTAYVRKVIDDHETGDVVIIYVMTHGRPLDEARSLRVLGTDGEQGEVADVAEWLLRGLARKNGPHILFLLDICYSGVAVDVQSYFDRGRSDHIWVIAGSEADAPAYDARFTRAITEVLRRIHNRDDLLGARSDQQYISLNGFALQVGVEVAGSGTEPQQVIGTRKPVTFDFSQLPFFENPGFTRIERPGRDTEKVPALRAFDQREAEHFLRSAGCGPHGSDFAGRTEQLAKLGTWTRSESGRLMVVTGRAGSGKSALLGALVGLTHPELAEHARPLLAHVAGPATQVVRDLAAVHGRHRDVRGFVDSIGSQLFARHEVRTPQVLLSRVRRRPAPAVIVVDAMDEAVEPATVWSELLGPLLATGNCRIAVALRPGALRELPALDLPEPVVVDLDEVAPTTLRRELQTFAESLLLHSKYAGEHTASRGAFATMLARALTNSAVPPQWGEFLIARLYVRHVIDHDLLPPGEAAAGALGATVPRSLQGVFELDMKLRGDRDDALPVLAAVAHARGYGIPAELIPRLAAIFDRSETPAKPQDVAAVLESLTMYLTIIPDESGVALYQLFHSELGEYVRELPGLTGSDAAGIHDVLVSTAVTADGRRNWSDAPPYARRHVFDHARSDEQRRAVLSDPEYVLCPAPEPVTAMRELAGDPVSGPLATAAIAVAEENEQLGTAMTESARIAVLALAATRLGAAPLARALAGKLGNSCYPILSVPLTHQAAVPRPSPAHSVLIGIDGSRDITFHPATATAPSMPVIRAPERVTALAVLRSEGRAELLVGCADGTARVLDQEAPGRQRLVLAGHDGAVRAVAVGRRRADTVLLTADDHALHLWDADTGRRLKSWPWHDRGIRGLEPATLPDGTGGVVVRSRRWLSVFDLTRETSHRVFPLGDGDCATGFLDDRPIAAHWAETGTLTVVDIGTRNPLVTRAGPARVVRASTAVAATAPSVFVTGDRAGHLWVWPPAGDRGREWEMARLPGEVTALTSYLHDGRPIVAAATELGAVGLWEFPSASPVRNWSARSAVRAFAAAAAAPERSPDERVPLFAAGPGFGGVVLVVRADDHALEIRHVTPDGQVGVKTVHAAGRRVRTTSVRSWDGWAVVQATDDNGREELWHPLTGDPLAPAEVGCPGRQDSRQANEFFTVVAAGRVHLRGNDDGTVCKRVVTGHGVEEQVVHAHTGRVTTVSLLNGEVVTFGEDGVVRFWHFDSLEPAGSLELPGAVGATTVISRFVVVETKDEVAVFERVRNLEEIDQ
ncbi:AAA family ATPase [Amycolatopsis sp. NPDC049691]|uniref:AAA family ATPase n=1 Tax=Amycolatopsis sp. NPDC049691 TaxID=3155155 RepID=UPI00343CEE65